MNHTNLQDPVKAQPYAEVILANTNLDANPIKVDFQTLAPSKYSKKWILTFQNPNAANKIAWKRVAKGATAPTAANMAAAYSAIAAKIVLSNAEDDAIFDITDEVYICADAGAMSYLVVMQPL